MSVSSWPEMSSYLSGAVAVQRGDSVNKREQKLNKSGKKYAPTKGVRALVITDDNPRYVSMCAPF
jgi:hypothetical protein